MWLLGMALGVMPVPAILAVPMTPGVQSTGPLPTPQFRRYGITDGLPSGPIYAAAQDHNGLMWFGSAGGLVRFNVFLDDREDASEMGYNRGNQYIYFYVEPGKHTISSKAENWADLSFEVRAGEVVFIKQEVEVGMLMARNNLVLLGDTEGRYLVKDASLGSVAKERK